MEKALPQSAVHDPVKIRDSLRFDSHTKLISSDHIDWALAPEKVFYMHFATRWAKCWTTES